MTFVKSLTVSFQSEMSHSDIYADTVANLTSRDIFSFGKYEGKQARF